MTTYRCPECDRVFPPLKVGQKFSHSPASRLLRHFARDHAWELVDAYQTVYDLIYPDQAAWPDEVVAVNEFATSLDAAVS